LTYGEMETQFHPFLNSLRDGSSCPWYLINRTCGPHEICEVKSVYPADNQASVPQLSSL